MSKTSPFADLHCHPGELIYHRLRDDQSQERFLAQDEHHPLRPDVIRDNCLKLILGKMAGPYLQSNFLKCSVARHSLVFAALYPIEMGFVQGRFRGGTFLASLLASVPFLNAIVGQLNIKTLNFSNRRFRYVNRGHYDYFDELETTYKYYQKKDEIAFREEANIDCKADNRTAEGSYVLVRHRGQLQQLDQSSDGRIAVILTIEGMHSFGRGHLGKSVKHNVEWDRLEERVLQWKRLDHPIFFITFAHHFNNSLCGHAHSFPKIIGTTLLNQEPGLGADFNAEGLRTLDLLLNIGQYQGLENGRRILIDVKHMSPASRKTYYGIISEHNRVHPHDRIPTIASHMGYSGRARLQDVIYGDAKKTRRAEKDGGREGGYTIDGTLHYFNPWGINLTAEDVVEIVRSKGIIGISMDERITSARRTRKVIRRKLNSASHKRKLYRNIVLNNLLGCIHAVFDSDLTDEDKSWIWSGLALGSDFDGYINPLDAYSAVSFYHHLEADLTEAITNFIGGDEQLAIFTRFRDNASDPANYVEEFVNKFMFKNAFDFAKEHLQDLGAAPPPVV